MGAKAGGKAGARRPALDIAALQDVALRGDEAHLRPAHERITKIHRLKHTCAQHTSVVDAKAARSLQG